MRSVVVLPEPDRMETELANQPFSRTLINGDTRYLPILRGATTGSVPGSCARAVTLAGCSPGAGEGRGRPQASSSSGGSTEAVPCTD